MVLPPYFRGRYTLKSGHSLGNVYKSSLDYFTGEVAVGGSKWVRVGGLRDLHLLSP